MAAAVAERVVGQARPSARSSVSWAIRPRQTITAAGSGRSRASRNGRQVPISAGDGLFCGGTQRTAFAIRQSSSASPSAGSAAKRPLAKPNRVRVA